MGKNEKILGEIILKEISDYEPTKHTIEWTDAFHLHWRNLVFYLNKQEFEQFMSCAMFALQKWKQLGTPDIRKDDMNIGLAGMGGLSFKHGFHPTYCAIEQLRENHFHFNYRSLRMDLSKQELLDLCNMFIETKKNLLNNTGKDVEMMTTDEYYNSHSSSNDILHFFEKIKNVNYVVLRWFTDLPNKLHPIHNDIDILVSNKEKNLITQTRFCEENDIRIPIDNYFPEDKAEEMLKTSILYNGIKIPNRKYYFLSFAYHILYHKFLDAGIPTKIEPFATEYRKRGEKRFPEYYTEMETLVRCFGYEDEITLELLYKILQKEGWYPQWDAPPGVIHDKPMLQKFIIKIMLLQKESQTEK